MWMKVKSSHCSLSDGLFDMSLAAAEMAVAAMLISVAAVSFVAVGLSLCGMRQS